MTSPPFEPSQFGRYELVELLAVGGMAEIFKAKTRGAHGFEKTLVIKRILPQLAVDSEFVDMFIDEAKLMGRLDHPKIVQVLDFGEIEGQYYMALEYIDGIDGLTLLRQCARRRCRPTTGIALYIVSNLLDALDYAHELCGPDGEKLGVVHRDISPSNIFISRLGDVKLGDFGIARAALRRGHSEGGGLKGKYGYMAPEQASGGAVDHRADIFAMGVVLAELLMIRRLFYARNDLDILLQVRDARLDRLDRYGARIPESLRDVLDPALARDANMRYQTAGVFRDALHRYLFDNRRMVRSTDVACFVQLLMQDDAPLELDAASRLSETSPLTAASAPAAVGHVDERLPQRPSLPTPGAISVDDPGADQTPTPVVSVGRKRRIVITPPARPVPVPIGLPDTGEAPRIAGVDALAAMPEMETGSSSSHFDLSSQIEADDDLPVAAPLPAASPAPEPALPRVGRVGVDEGRRGPPSESGEFSARGLFRLLFRLAVDEETGLLVTQTEEVSKEIFLVHGDPHFVSSSRPEELFGQYLVAKGAISEGELAMALAMLPHFDGKLGDTLVGLKLMRPVQVLRHLTNQVRHKLLDIFTWEKGFYWFYPEETCQRESAPLGLDAFEIIGAGIRGTSEERLVAWAEALTGRRLRGLSGAPVPPEVFRLGGLPRRVYDKLNGRHTVEEILESFDDPAERLEYVRMIVLLEATGLVV